GRRAVAAVRGGAEEGCGARAAAGGDAGGRPAAGRCPDSPDGDSTRAEAGRGGGGGAAIPRYRKGASAAGPPPRLRGGRHVAVFAEDGGMSDVRFLALAALGPDTESETRKRRGRTARGTGGARPHVR